jgi:CHASE3 domain sensor protein
MTEDKVKRLVVAITVGAVLLVVILCSVMLFGIIKINKEKRAIQELEEKIALLDEMIEEGEDTYEIRKTRYWIEKRALELGYTFDGSTDVT